MPEQAPLSPEKHENIILDPERELPTAEQAEPLRAGETDPAKQLEQARAAAEQSAESTAGKKNPLEELKKAEAAPEPEPQHVLSHELEAVNLQQEFRSIRRKESSPERLLSRVIHQPVVRVVSEVTGKTISRPSGLLGGGLVALLGTTGYLYYAKHMGFRYNYLVFLALFLGGFVVGLILELAVWLLTTSRRHAAD